MPSYSTLDAKTLEQLKNVATRLRIQSIIATNASNSGHPTSCASAAEIMSVLFFHTMKFSVTMPRDPSSDRFVMSKGHAAPILYAAWSEAGLFPEDQLLSLRKLNSDLEGHPTPRLPFVDVATGSLGQGLSCAAGMAYTGKYFDKASFRVYCLIGDGESAEGSIWEALSFASKYKLDNLVAIFDINRLGQSEPTAFQHDLDTYKRRLDSFGWNTYVVDGHDIDALCKALYEAANVKGKPTCLLAKTYKGKDFPGIEDQENWHGKPLGDKAEEVIKVLKATLKNNGPNKIVPHKPLDDAPIFGLQRTVLPHPPAYKQGEPVATRLAYGTALVKLGQNNSRIIALDGDTKNSTYADKFKKMFPDRFIECYIAEQNMVGVAIGCSTRNRTIPFVSAFAAFFTRTFDQLRMGAISQANIKCVGSHAGVSIGEDGPSQMALEDLAMFRSIPNSTVFYPSDAVSTERACELAANIDGICFIRTSRPATPVLYDTEEPFEVGKAKIVRSDKKDSVLVIGAGVTLHEAVKAADELKESGTHIRVMDIFTLKPIDKEGILKHAKAAGNRIVTVEDHYPEGGLGEAVLSAVASDPEIVVKKLAVYSLPRSGKPEELMSLFSIDSTSIKNAIQKF